MSLNAFKKLKKLIVGTLIKFTTVTRQIVIFALIVVHFID